MTTTTKPVSTIRDGSLKATVWRNKGEKGDFHSVRFTRTWRDDQGTFHDSDSFSGTELLRLAHLAAKAYDQLASLRETSESIDAE
jgi:hypothetical protein